jgi:hypothetical protein
MRAAKPTPSTSTTKPGIEMAQAYRIRVYGRQRRHIDPRQFAQVLILLGRHLYEKQQTTSSRPFHGNTLPPSDGPEGQR